MKSVKKILAVSLVAAGLAASAGVSDARAEGATVIDEFGCALLGASSGLGINLFTTVSHEVITPSGNTVLKCHFDIPDGYEPDKAINNKGFLCNTFLGVTTDSKSTVTPGGEAVLTCNINGNES